MLRELDVGSRFLSRDASTRHGLKFRMFVRMIAAIGDLPTPFRKGKQKYKLYPKRNLLDVLEIYCFRKRQEEYIRKNIFSKQNS